MKEKDTKKIREAKIPGITYSSLGKEAFENLRRIDMMTATNKGHGFAAEYANHLDDKFKNFDFFGRNKVQLVGEDNAPNGADRLVNGVYIQTKYCATASKSVNETFSKDGFFKYFKDGEPMKIEVPKDQYQEAIENMKKKILEGKVVDKTGTTKITDPEKAYDIIKEGGYTYKQAKNIAKAGNIDSIIYDVKNAAIIATSAAGLTFSISFAMAIIEGKSIEEAVDIALESSFKVFTISFIGSFVTSQLQKTALVNTLSGDAAKKAVKMMGTKKVQLIANAFNNSGKKIYGAAAIKKVEKLLKGNMVTSTVTVVLMSVPDTINTFRGRISLGQLFKNTVNTAASTAGGSVGWVGGGVVGAAIGSVVPGVGTAAGAVAGKVVGSMLGGFGIGSASKFVADKFIEDDSKEMEKIINDVFSDLVINYLLVEKERDKVFEKIKLTPKTLRDMYATKDREKFVIDLMEPIVEKIVKSRKKVSTNGVDYEAAVMRFVEKNLKEEYLVIQEMAIRVSQEIERGINEDVLDVNEEILEDLDSISKMNKEESDVIIDFISENLETVRINEERFKKITNKVLDQLTEKYAKVKLEYIFLQVLRKYRETHTEHKKYIINVISLILGQEMVGVDVIITREFLDALINTFGLSVEDYKDCLVSIALNLKGELEKKKNFDTFNLQKKIQEIIIEEDLSEYLCEILKVINEDLLTISEYL